MNSMYVICVEYLLHISEHTTIINYEMIKGEKVIGKQSGIFFKKTGIAITLEILQ